MKEIFKFVYWRWSKFETWQKMFVFSMFLQGIALPLDRPWDFYVSGLGMLIILFYFAKWVIWDGVKKSWSDYKQHRNELFTTIKNSDPK